MTEDRNREHTGGGEQNRREQKSDDPRVEKNPPRDRDGRAASEIRPDSRSRGDDPKRER